MDADMVREVEFGRKIRGYDMAEVDAFLEKMERTFRRKDLEQENLQHKLEELTGARDAQGEKLETLNASISSLREENAQLKAQLDQERQSAAKRNEQLQQVRNHYRRKPLPRSGNHSQSPTSGGPKAGA